MRKLLNKEHSGSVAFETIILTPLMFVTFLILLCFLFTTLSYISYNNLANSIAQELNMRQTGYETAIQNYTSMPAILTYSNNISEDGNIDPSFYLNDSNVITTPNTEALRAGTYFALDKYKEQFTIPFSQITKIEINTNKAIDPEDGRKMSGTIVIVNIYYKNMILGKPGDRSIQMKATGYGIIA